MPGQRIPDLTAIAGASTANDDNLVIFDTDANTTKRILRSQLAAGLVGDLPYTPSGGISATTVPTAIAELDTEKTTLSAVLARLDDVDGSSLSGYMAAGITGTAQAGASTTITLASGALATDDAYNGLTVQITGGTGSGQVRTISDYVGSTKVATVSTAWTTTPDATSVYNIAYPRTAQSKLRETVSVKDFGAVGDGVTDDTVAVQAAFNYLQTNGGTLVVNGVCAISASLTILAGAKWIIEGAGGSTSGLKAIASMDWLINMGNSSGTYEGEMCVRDLYLDGNNLSGGINANHARYSRFENLRISQIESSKTGIKAGNWVNRITNCVITGGDKSVHAYSPSVAYNNNFVIDKNAFTSTFGIYFDPTVVGSNIGYPNNMIVRDNAFDVCTKAAIFGPNGFSRGLIITGNYFEGCGGAAVSVETSAGVFANRYGAMIFPRNINVGGLGWNGLRIHDNEFLNCCQTAPAGNKYCINLEQATDVNVYDNVIYPTGTYDAFIGLSGVGVVATAGTNVAFKHADPENMLDQLVKNDVTTTTGFGNFKAKFFNRAGSTSYAVPDICADMASWTVAGPLTVTQSFANGLNVVNFNRASGANTYYEETDANRMRMWQNRYLRVNGLNAFVSPGGGNNLRVIVEIDTGSGYVTVMDRQRTDNGPVTEGTMFFVPPTATKLKITLSPTVPGEINVYNLKVIDPSIEM